MRGLNIELGDFAAGLEAGDIPAPVIDRAKVCLAHGLIVGAAGRAADFGHMAEEAIGRCDGGGARLLTSGRNAPAPLAAFVNGALLHARVQEDTHGTAHLGTVVIPAALAVAEETQADGSTLLAGVVAGYEVGAALAREFTSHTTPRGFRASAVYGPFASAAAAGRILGLGTDTLAAAISLASAFAGGTTESFAAGTDEWHFENGAAAQSGVLAARLAEGGAKGASSALEGDAGFLTAFAGTTASVDRVVAELGRTWEILNVTFKLFPVCAFNQTPVALALRAAARADLSASQIASIDVAMNAYEASYPGMGHAGPFDSIGQTQMSTRFCVALALTDGDVTYQGLSQFDEPAVLDLVRRITVLPDADRAPMAAQITVTALDGRSITEHLDEEPERLLSWDFAGARALAYRLQPETLLTRESIDDLLATVDRVEQLPRAAAIADALMASAVATPPTTT